MKNKKNMIVLHIDKLETCLQQSKALFTFYLALITVLKAETHKNSSKIYYNELKDIFVALVVSYEYDRDYSTFIRHIHTLEDLELIKLGKHANKYIDIKHKSVNWQKEKIKFIKIPISELEAIVRMNFNDNSLKVGIKNLSLTDELIKKASNINNKYFKKVYFITNNNEIYRLRNSDNIITNYSKYIDEQKNLALIRDAHISSKVVKVAKVKHSSNDFIFKTAQLQAIDFKNFNMNIKSFHIINKTRRTKNKKNITIEHFQEQLNQLYFLVTHANYKFSKTKEHYLAYHLINFDTLILPDHEISNYYRFKNTGTTEIARINSYSEVLNVSQSEQADNNKENKLVFALVRKNRNKNNFVEDTQAAIEEEVSNAAFDPMRENSENNYRYFLKKAKDLTTKQLDSAVKTVFNKYSAFNSFRDTTDVEILKRVSFYRYLNIELIT